MIVPLRGYGAGMPAEVDSGPGTNICKSYEFGRN